MSLKSFQKYFRTVDIIFPTPVAELAEARRIARAETLQVPDVTRWRGLTLILVLVRPHSH